MVVPCYYVFKAAVAKYLTELPVEAMELISFFDLLATESHQMP